MADAVRLNAPVAVAVRVDAQTRLPTRVRTPRSKRWLRVEHVLDAWQIDDRWWTEEPVRRSYFACQTDTGSVLTIYFDVTEGGWYGHRG